MCLMKWAFECLQIDHAHTNHNLYMAVLFVLLLECDDHAVLFTNFIVTFVSVMQMTEICLTCGLTISLDDLQAHKNDFTSDSIITLICFTFSNKFSPCT